MAVIITCSYRQSWCEFAQQRLEEMGVATPSASSQTGIDPLKLTEKMTDHYGLRNATESVIPAPSIGKAWQIAAADVLVSNAEHEVWGWASPDNIRFLDFWRDFDPHCKFLLLYGTPVQSLSEDLSTDSTDLTDKMRQLENWQRFHEGMLRFYQSYPDDCLLANISHMEDMAQDISQLLGDRLDFPARRLNTSRFVGQSELIKLVVASSIGDLPDGQSTIQELDASADLPGPNGFEAVSYSTNTAFDELRAFRAAEATTASLEAENVRLTEELAFAKKTLTEMEQIRDDHRSTLEEKDLLTLQLEQVQEELQKYFNKYNDLKDRTTIETGDQTSVSDVKSISSQQPAQSDEQTDLTIDFRGYVDGQGWHHAEDHGRWAGMDLSSRVRIPPLGRRRHKLELRIVDAMSMDIVNGIKLFFDSHELQSHVRILSNVGGNLAPLRRLKASLQSVEKPFPVCVRALIPSEAIDEASEHHEVIVNVPRSVSPASNGGTDTRHLSICVETMRITRDA